MQASFRAEDLAFARAIADVMLDQFEDAESGGFYFPIVTCLVISVVVLFFL